jgi:transmembrane sensor
VKKEEMLDEVLKSWGVPVNQTEAEAWEMLQARIKETKVIPLYKRPAFWTAAAAAACIIAFVITVFNDSDVRVLASTQQEVVLPDGSVVILDQGAELMYDEAWESRELSLIGEAFFTVQKGTKFTVKTDQGTVSVLGTSFNVYADHANLQVECFTGKVKVTSGENEEILTKGLAVKLRNNALTSPYAHNIDQPAFQSDLLQYTQADLMRVIEDVEVRFGVEVNVTSDISAEEFTGQFEVSDASKTLSLIAKAMGMDLTPGGTGVYTLSKN